MDNQNGKFMPKSSMIRLQILPVFKFLYFEKFIRSKGLKLKLVFNNKCIVIYNIMVNIQQDNKYMKNSEL